MTATVPDELQHLDFDPTPGCEAPACLSGGAPVTHRLIAVRCACGPILICGVCVTHLRRYATHWMVAATCLGCRTVVGPLYLGDLYRIEPLP